MSPIQLYGTSLSLLIDLYELTMAAGYFKAGLANRKAVFQLFFRKEPFKGKFAIAAGLELAMEIIDQFAFDESDIDYLKTLTGSDGKPLFEKEFLQYLQKFSFTCDVDAMPEGTVVFPQEPLLTVRGPIIEAQLLETVLLTVINFQSLIATKSSRICLAAGSDEVIEFGVRRAQGIDGALSASRAAFIGGCKSTSNVLAGKFFGIPVKGTHAHSWVLTFNEEKEAFRTWARVMPNNCIFLVDTYQTIGGVKAAIEVAQEMKKEGVALKGVRLDSGDIAALSIEVRKLFDEAGLSDVAIMASNELDEHLIRDVKQQGGMVTLWGVGTNLVTGKEQPALDGVYKLTAITNEVGNWEYKVKISEQSAKVTNPGKIQVRRFIKNSIYIGDMMYDAEKSLTGDEESVNMYDPLKLQSFAMAEHFDLLVPIYRSGRRVYESPSLKDIQAHANEEKNSLNESVKRFLHPSPYFVGMEKSLHEIKLQLMQGK